ncbi:MAG: hypothetical protein K2M02_00015, partial [Duncaniella sp.]|nr:hypothetical protein [Duncaniella sp.]
MVWKADFSRSVPVRRLYPSSNCCRSRLTIACNKMARAAVTGLVIVWESLLNRSAAFYRPTVSPRMWDEGINRIR